MDGERKACDNSHMLSRRGFVVLMISSAILCAGEKDVFILEVEGMI